MSEPIIQKYCPACKRTKSTTEFHKCRTRYDGLQGMCIDCKKLWAQSPIGHQAHQKAKRRYKKSDKGKITDKRYRQGKVGKTTREKNHAKFLKHHPNYAKAKMTVNKAVKQGIIPKIKTQSCIRCGKQAQARHHHKGYAKENYLTFVTLCTICHIGIHKGKYKLII